MIIKFNLVRLSIILLLVIFFPLIQNQWLNLFLFDKYNFTIYKFLYYLSGIIFPTIVYIFSLSNFTYYKFNNINIRNQNIISGKILLIITVISLFTLSTLISGYILINFKLLFYSINSNNNFFIDFDITKYLISVAIISILLLFRKIKFFIKKITLINFFLISFIIWISKINNILFDYTYFNNFIKFEHLNFINILLLISVEILYYLWSYISYGSYLSDWKIPFPKKADLSPIFIILIFYLMIILYYFFLNN